jgi:hypothetical protein
MVKPVHAVTSIKQSPVLKCLEEIHTRVHLLCVKSRKHPHECKIEMEISVLYVVVFIVERVKPDHAVTSIRQSPVLKWPPFSCPIIENLK